MVNVFIYLVALTLSIKPGETQHYSSLPTGCDSSKVRKPVITVTTSQGESLSIVNHQLIIPINTSSFYMNCTFFKPLEWHLFRKDPINVVIRETTRHFLPSTWSSDECYTSSLIFSEVREEISALYTCSPTSPRIDSVDIQLFSGHRLKNVPGYLVRRGKIYSGPWSSDAYRGISMACQVNHPSVLVQFYYSHQINPNSLEWTLIPRQYVSFNPVKETIIQKSALPQQIKQVFLKCQTNISGDHYIVPYVNMVSDEIKLVPKPGVTEILTFPTSARPEFKCGAKQEVKIGVVDLIQNVHFEIFYDTYSNWFEGIAILSYMGNEPGSSEIGVVQCSTRNGTILHSWKYKLFDDPKKLFPMFGVHVDPKTRRATCVTSAVNDTQLLFITASTREQETFKKFCSRIYEKSRCPDQHLLSPVESTPVSVMADLPPVSGSISCISLDGSTSARYFLTIDGSTIYTNLFFRDRTYDEHVSHEITCVTRSPKVADSLKCKCIFTKRLFALPIVPVVTWSNGTVQLVPSTDVSFTISEFQKLSFHFKVFRVNIPSGQIREVSCLGFTPDLPKHYFANWLITPKQHKLDLEDYLENSVIEITEDQTGINISCVATSYPTPRITWNISEAIRNSNATKIFEEVYESNISLSTVESVIHLAVEDVQGLEEIQCVAEVNQVALGGETHFVSKNFRLQRMTNRSEWSQTTIIGISTLGLIAILLSLWATFLIVRAKFQKAPAATLSKQTIEKFYEGNPSAAGDNGYENAQRMPFAGTKYQLDLSCLQLQEIILGIGAYGVVMKGFINGTKSTEVLEVAVKMVKPDTDIAYLTALLGELKLMAFIGNHPHIAELIGAVTTKLTENEIFVVLRFYSNGSLKGYLKDNGHFASDLNVDDTEIPKEQHDPLNYTNCVSVRKTITLKDLVQWSYEISLGMDYLVSKNVIHGDLATRNILLDENRQAKIADFGLARQLYNCSLYIKKSKVPLPWRWMSIEAMCDMEFSQKSDVWAFGVTVWEIFSLGKLPFPLMNFDSEFVNYLKNGHRLSKPELASQQIYNHVMYSAWKLDPETRPSFSELSKTLEGFLGESEYLEITPQICNGESDNPTRNTNYSVLNTN